MPELMKKSGLNMNSIPSLSSELNLKFQVIHIKNMYRHHKYNTKIHYTSIQNIQPHAVISRQYQETPDI